MTQRSTIRPLFDKTPVWGTRRHIYSARIGRVKSNNYPTKTEALDALERSIEAADSPVIRCTKDGIMWVAYWIPGGGWAYQICRPDIATGRVTGGCTIIGESGDASGKAKTVAAMEKHMKKWNADLSKCPDCERAMTGLCQAHARARAVDGVHDE